MKKRDFEAMRKRILNSEWLASVDDGEHMPGVADIVRREVDRAVRAERKAWIYAVCRANDESARRLSR
jgi:hypothetical protein